MNKEKKIYTLNTSGPNPIEYYVSFTNEPPDFSRAAKLFTMMAKDLTQNNFKKRQTAAIMQGNLS